MTKNDIILKDVTALKIVSPESKFTGDNTYTSLFILPAYDIFLSASRHKHFVNAYIDDRLLRHCFKRPLFFLVRYEAHTEALLELTKYLRSKKGFVYTYLAGTEGKALLRMFVFECPAHYRQDYDHFLKGQYSKFSLNYKDQFVETIRDISGAAFESLMYGAIYKTTTHKKKMERIMGERLNNEQEFFGALKPEFEVFRFKKQENDNK